MTKKFKTRKQMKKQLKDLLWSRPDCYMGSNYHDYYVIYGRNRDSCLLENHNYDEILEALERENTLTASCIDNENPLVFDVRDHHWLVGWIEYILVSKRASNAVLSLVCDIVEDLESYPLLSEDRYSEKIFDAMCDHWDQCSLDEKIDYCKRNHESIFVARRTISDLPDCIY